MFAWKVLQRSAGGQGGLSTEQPPWQCQTGLTRKSMGFSVAAGFVQIWGCFGRPELPKKTHPIQAAKP